MANWLSDSDCEKILTGPTVILVLTEFTNVTDKTYTQTPHDGMHRARQKSVRHFYFLVLLGILEVLCNNAYVSSETVVIYCIFLHDGVMSESLQC